MNEEEGPQPSRGMPKGVQRVGLVVLFFCALIGVAKVTGLADDMTVDGLRALMQASGAWGRLVYVLAFAVGYAITIPGMFFVAVGVAAYGPIDGGCFAYATSLLAVSLNYWLGRLLGGQSLSELRWGFVQRALKSIDARPVRTIALLRLVLMLTPPFDYGLGLSSVSFPRFLLGSALGLIPPVVVAVLIFDRLIVWF